MGIPRGSIRALLTILVVGFIVLQTVRGEKIGLLWSETLMIMLAHYFTSRRFVELPRKVREQLEAGGKIPYDSNPLYLPKHTIRGLIILSFAGLAWYLYREGRLMEHQSLAILGTVGVFFGDSGQSGHGLVQQARSRPARKLVGRLESLGHAAHRRRHHCRGVLAPGKQTSLHPRPNGIHDARIDFVLLRLPLTLDAIRHGCIMKRKRPQSLSEEIGRHG